MTGAAFSLRPLALKPANEAARLAAVRRYDILDTPPDGSFDRITALAAGIFSTPISIISLVDHDRIWFKSHHGLDTKQIGRDPGLCASAILQNEALLLTDAKTDARALANPLVAGDFGLRFYLGVPLRTRDGFNLGTLCVIDRKPRTVTDAQIAILEHLASVVMDQMELRLSARRAVGDLSRLIEQKEAALERAEMMAKEVDHRVKNSLQLVSGLLRLQSRTLGQTEAAAQLSLAASRVLAVGRVHEHISLSDAAGATDVMAYLKRLCADLSTMLPGDSRSRIVVSGDAAEVPTERIAPLGLIVNELVTNAAKHGAGRITVRFARSAPGAYELSVSDDGAGLSADFDPTAGGGLGMKLIHGLAQQLGGELAFGAGEGGRGARFSIRFADAAPTGK